MLDRSGKTCLMYSAEFDMLREMAYLYLLSTVGQHLDSLALHRIHALGVAHRDRGILLLLLQGAEKSTMSPRVLGQGDFTLLRAIRTNEDGKGTAAIADRWRRRAWSTVLPSRAAASARRRRASAGCEGAPHGARSAGHRRATRERSPNAWIVDFTIPVGIVTKALLDNGHKAAGLCSAAMMFSATSRRCSTSRRSEHTQSLAEQRSQQHQRGVLLSATPRPAGRRGPARAHRQDRRRRREGRRLPRRGHDRGLCSQRTASTSSSR